MSDLSGENSDKNLKDSDFEIFSSLLIGLLTPKLDESKFTPEQLKIIRNAQSGIAIAHGYEGDQILVMHELYKELKNGRTDKNEGKDEAILRHQLNITCPEDTKPYKNNNRKEIENIGFKIFLSDEYCSATDNIFRMNNQMNDLSYLMKDKEEVF